MCIEREVDRLDTSEWDLAKSRMIERHETLRCHNLTQTIQQCLTATSVNHGKKLPVDPIAWPVESMEN